MESFIAESVVMKNFSHPNVLGLLGVVLDTPDGTPYLVLPFMENGNLKNYLKSKREKVCDANTLPQVSITLNVCRQDVATVSIIDCHTQRKIGNGSLTSFSLSFKFPVLILANCELLTSYECLL